MHEAYVIGPSAQISQYILLKEIKKLVPRALLSYISTREFLKTLKGCENHEPKASAFRHFSRVLIDRPMQGNPDSGIYEIFACGIRNTGLWNPEFSFWNPGSR